MRLVTTRAEQLTKRSSEVWPRLGQAGPTQAHLLRRMSEIAVPRHEDDFLVTEPKRGREVNCIVAAEPQIFGVLASAHGEPLIDANRDELRVKLLENRERFPVLCSPKAI